MTQPTATITWADGTVETLPLTPAGGNALQLYVRNGGLPDNWGHSWAPQPKFVQSVTVNAPGYICPTRDGQGMAYDATGTHLCIRPDQKKYLGTRYLGTWSHPNYAPGADAHTIDGGCSIYFRFVPENDLLETSFLTSPSFVQIQKALEIMDLDLERINKWPLLKKTFNLYTMDGYAPGTPNFPGTTSMSWLLTPENFCQRNPGHYHPITITEDLQWAKHWYSFPATKAGGEGHSVAHYSHDLWYMANAMMKAGTNLQSAIGDMATGLYLLRYKCCYGLIDIDTTAPNVFVKGRWRNEKSGANEIWGSAGTVSGPAKEWDRGLCVAHTLYPSDPLIARAFQVRSNFWLNSGNQWNGAGGARQLGRALSNLLDFYKATGNPAFKAKAEQNITYAFTAAVNGMDRLWFKEMSTSNDVSFGEGMLTLTYVMKWVFDHGVRPDLQGHLQNMLAWYLQYGGAWNGTDKFICGYYGNNSSATGSTVQYLGVMQNVFWTGLRRFGTPAQDAQFEAIEKQAYTAYSVSQWDSDIGALGSSAEKWLPMYAESGTR